MALPYLFYISFPFLIVCIFPLSIRIFIEKSRFSATNQFGKPKRNNCKLKSKSTNDKQMTYFSFTVQRLNFKIIPFSYSYSPATTVQLHMCVRHNACNIINVLPKCCNKISICVWHASVCYCICVVILFSLLFVVHCIILQLAIGKLDVFLVEIFLMCKFCDIVFFLLLFRFFFAADDKCNQPVIVCAIYERWIVLRTCKPFCEPLYLCCSSYDYQASLVNWKVQAANLRNAQINAIEYLCLPLIDVPMFEMRTLFNLITFLSFLVFVCLAFIFHLAK